MPPAVSHSPVGLLIVYLRFNEFTAAFQEAYLLRAVAVNFTAGERRILIGQTEIVNNQANT